MVLQMTKCPSCGKGKRPKVYLCGKCWYGLNDATRRRLMRADGKALGRLQELFEQLNNDVPLSEIEVAA